MNESFIPIQTDPYTADFVDPSLSTVTENPDVDQTGSIDSAKTNNALQIVNALGTFGSSIASLVTGKPLNVVQTTNGVVVPVGSGDTRVVTAAAQLQAQKDTQTNIRLAIIVGGAIAAAFVFALATGKVK